MRMNPEAGRQLRNRGVPAQRTQRHFGLESGIVLSRLTDIFCLLARSAGILDA